MDQIFKGGGRSEPDPAALLKYEFASAPTKVDQDDPDEADESKENQKMTSMPLQARRLGGQPSSIRSPFLETAR